MSRALLAGLLLLAAPALAPALDPQLNQPYRLEVVLHVAQQRLLTEVFKEQVERELGDSLRAAFGPMVDVQVVREHPLLKVVLERGLAQGVDPAPTVTDVKTHFVLIDYVNGRYRIQARQVDGLTGQPTPVVRESRTADRQFVARTAALMLDQDFGMVGTIVERIDDQEVKVVLKGGGLGVPVDRWVKKDDVLAISQISRAGAGERAVRVPWALLQVVQRDPSDGVCVCKLFKRYADVLDGASVLDCRCLKLNTISAPLRMRFVRTGTRGPTTPPPLEVHAREHGFDTKEPNMAQGVTDNDGFFQSRRIFKHVAFVNVLSSDKPLARIPVALVDETTVRCPISVTVEVKAPLLIRRDLWVRGLYDNYLAQAELFKDLKELVQKPEQATQALKRAQAGLKDMQRDLGGFKTEHQGLVEANKAVADNARVSLAEGEQRLRELESTQSKLEAFATNLEDAIRKENDPKIKALKAKVEEGRLLEDDAEFGKAIALYEEILKAGLESKVVSDHLAELKAAWQVRNEEHNQARDFIYTKWPALPTAKLKEGIAEVRKALQTCQAAGDKLTPQKALKAAIGHVAKLKKELSTLNPEINEEDVQTAKVIATVAEELNQLITDVTTTYLK